MTKRRTPMNPRSVKGVKVITASALVLTLLLAVSVCSAGTRWTPNGEEFRGAGPAHRR